MCQQHVCVGGQVRRGEPGPFHQPQLQVSEGGGGHEGQDRGSCRWGGAGEEGA